MAVMGVRAAIDRTDMAGAAGVAVSGDFPQRAGGPESAQVSRAAAEPGVTTEVRVPGPAGVGELEVLFVPEVSLQAKAPVGELPPAQRPA